MVFGMGNRMPLATLYLALQPESIAAYYRWRTTIWRRFDKERTAKLGVNDQPAGMALIPILDSSDHNLQAAATVLKAYAATQPVIDLQFREPFIYSSPLRDKFVQPGTFRSVKFRLASPDLAIMHRDLMKELADVKIKQNMPLGQRFRDSPNVKAFHAIRDEHSKLKSTITVMKQTSRLNALECFESIRNVDAAKEFGVLRMASG